MKTIREIKTEIKKLIATWCLDWALSVLPDGEFKVRYAMFLTQNIDKL